uniref:Taste receptor type 2 n=1 Tax=Amphiprion percula TaxID=161767 RepID=A0A3P8T4Y4_AMPPE
MAPKFISMSDEAILLINGPLVFLNIIANIFYIYCLIFSRQRLKQPLLTLLGLLVWCSVVYCTSLIATYVTLHKETRLKAFLVPWMIVQYYAHNSMTCYAWLNFYYYIQIVPAQRSLWIWMKKNIRSVIYVALAVDTILLLFNSTVGIVSSLLRRTTYINDTWTGHVNHELHVTNIVSVINLRLYIVFCLCVMMVSSFSTVCYLHRHMKSMAQSSSKFTSPRIQSQRRVTITGILQGVFYLLYDSFYLLCFFTWMFPSHFVLSSWIFITATSLYISGTTVNLGIGQAIFRQRAVDVWKAIKALFGHFVSTLVNETIQFKKKKHFQSFNSFMLLLTKIVLFNAAVGRNLRSDKIKIELFGHKTRTNTEHH